MNPEMLYEMLIRCALYPERCTTEELAEHRRLTQRANDSARSVWAAKDAFFAKHGLQ